MESLQKSNEFNIRIRRLAVILAGMVLAVASCGGDDEGSAATTQSPATSAATGGDGAGTVIDVDEKDFTIELSTMELTPGTYTFVTTNNGQPPTPSRSRAKAWRKKRRTSHPGTPQSSPSHSKQASTSSIARWATTRTWV